jgi:hypothetical protein
MRVFAVWIERPFDVSVQRSQHADARMHQRSAALRCHEVGFADSQMASEKLARRRALPVF